MLIIIVQGLMNSIALIFHILESRDIPVEAALPMHS